MQCHLKFSNIPKLIKMGWKIYLCILLIQTVTTHQPNKITQRLYKLDWLIKKYKRDKSVFTKRQSCVPLEFNQLMSMYTAKADYNPTYLAATDTEAMLMPNLLWSNKDIQNYEFIIKNITERFNVQKQNASMASKIRTVIAKKLALPLNSSIISDKISKTTIKRTQGVITSKNLFCIESGDMDYVTKGAYLCSSCSVTTSMDEGRFPKYVNEVVCQSGAQCLKGEGSCKQNTIYIGMLYKERDCQLIEQNGQKILMEKWSYSRTPIKISCECQVKTDSIVYKYFVKKGTTTPSGKSSPSQNSTMKN